VIRIYIVSQKPHRCCRLWTTVHRLVTMHTPPKQTVLTNRQTATQGHSRSSVVVPIDAS